jgi:valine--pyruvate aminotransferase
MDLSQYGRKFTKTSGIGQLMDDLGHAMSVGKDLCMLGGGNPGFIPEVAEEFRRELDYIARNEEVFRSALGNYDSPIGDPVFREALANLLNKEYGWGLGPENIAITLGSQSSFYALFNFFAGERENGRRKKIMLPLTPEYIGYADLGIETDIFKSFKPGFEFIGDTQYKYHINFDAMEDLDDVAAICVSRPTNPTGNVLTDQEVHKLDALAGKLGVPLILDNAYGTPFPNIIFTEAEPIFTKNTILCMSLSKLGLPGTRTGIVIANEEITTLISRMNAIAALAPASMGTAMTRRLVENGRLLEISRDIIRPYYQSRAMAAADVLTSQLDGLNCRIHKPEGALFLWLWCKDLPIKSEELYERLKKRGVLVIPGHHFFTGVDPDWSHRHECIRITYSQSEEVVNKGLRIIAEEVHKAYSHG